MYTLDSQFEYQMRKIIEKFKNDWDLQELTAEELQEKIWVSLAAQFGQTVLKRNLVECITVKNSRKEILDDIKNGN